MTYITLYTAGIPFPWRVGPDSNTLSHSTAQEHLYILNEIRKQPQLKYQISELDRLYSKCNINQALNINILTKEGEKTSMFF